MQELFDYAFKEYANRWKFKSPFPADLFRTLEDASAVDLDWFWSNSLETGNPEYEITLKKEIELLSAFIEFERLKNDNHFDFHIIVDPELFPESVMIPPMLFQLFVENSIKHGLLLQEEKGNLWIRFRYRNEDIVCTIEDDGVGIEIARENRDSTLKTHKSLGTKITRERIDLLNKLGHMISVEINKRKPKGSIVKIIIKEE